MEEKKPKLSIFFPALVHCTEGGQDIGSFPPLLPLDRL